MIKRKKMNQTRMMMVLKIKITMRMDLMQIKLVLEILINLTLIKTHMYLTRKAKVNLILIKIRKWIVISRKKTKKNKTKFNYVSIKQLETQIRYLLSIVILLKFTLS